MSRHIEALGESGADFERFAQSEGAQRHRETIEHAESIGVFGVPTVVIEDELFWGGDRLWMVREAIEARLLEGSRLRRHRPE
jgi:2-hydroxychromene-2-carboxylate isomerase